MVVVVGLVLVHRLLRVLFAMSVLYVGTCFSDDKERPATAILTLEIDEQCVLTRKDQIVTTPQSNPGWISRINGDLVYVAYENDPGSVQAFKIEPESHALVPHGDAAPSLGRHPCYTSLDSSGRWLFVANYSDGQTSVCVLPVQPDGSVGPSTSSVKFPGGDAIDPALGDRQESAHCHCAVPHVSGRWVVCCDLGLSAVFVLGFDPAAGLLEFDPASPRHLRLGPGAGCRHACWDAAGDALFVNNELDGTVTAARFDAGTGGLSATATVSALPEGQAPTRAHHRGGSDIYLHPGGRWLLCGQRGADPGSLSVLEVLPGPALRLAGHASTRGRVPRNFKLLAGGRHVVVGNQESMNVASFSFDEATGELSFISEVGTAPHKACNISGERALHA